MANENNIFDDATMSALKQCITGMTIKEITTEYVRDEDSGDMIQTKQKICEKSVPPNIDIIKLIYQKLSENKRDYESFTDEELEKEKTRLLNELKEKENGGGKNKT